MIERIVYLITLSILLIKKLIGESVGNVIAFSFYGNESILNNQFVLTNSCRLNGVIIRRPVYVLQFLR